MKKEIKNKLLFKLLNNSIIYKNQFYNRVTLFLLTKAGSKKAI